MSSVVLAGNKLWTSTSPVPWVASQLTVVVECNRNPTFLAFYLKNATETIGFVILTAECNGNHRVWHCYGRVK
jgi:hypothetical protein